MHLRHALALLALSGLVAVQLTLGQAPRRSSLEERLAEVEQRLAALEASGAARDGSETQSEPPGEFSAGAEAKLDRLEVRLIQLENQGADCECAEAQRGLQTRVRSLERQVARLRASVNR